MLCGNLQLVTTLILKGLWS